MEKPKVTIVTVSFNAAELIEETILSVIRQDYPNLEYIIIDGGSKDGTVDIIKKYEDCIACWVSEPDKGLYDAMNKGIQLATGDWINFRNCGDPFLERDSLSKLFNNPVGDNISIVHADCYRIRGDYYYYGKPSSLKWYTVFMPLIHPATFIRVSEHRKRLFDLSHPIAADYDLITKCIKDGLQFEHRAIPIVIFPEGGCSDLSWRKALPSHLRIQGYNDSFWGRIKGYWHMRRIIADYCIRDFTALNRIRNKRLIKKGVLIPMPLPYPKYY